MKKRRLKENWELCRHRSYILDKDERSVTCEECDKNLDPFDLLVDLSRSEGYRATVDADRQKTAQRLAYLKGEERKVKARLKNALRKDADAAVAEERARWRKRIEHAGYKSTEIIRLAEHIGRALGEAARAKEEPVDA